jgi:polar amino acid transport system substrate-binding protein
MRLGLALSMALFAAPAVGQDKTLVFDTQDFPPFSYLEGGKPAGPVVEIIQLVCSRMKTVKPEFRLLPWARAQNEVQNGEAQGLFLIGYNAERAEWLTFSPPLVLTEYGFFVHSKSTLQYKAGEDIKGFTIGVYGPSNTSTTLESIKGKVQPDLKIDMTPDDIAAFRKLAAQRIDAVFSNRDVGRMRLKNLGLGEVRYAGRYEPLKYFIGFSKKHADKALVEVFNTTLTGLIRDGSIAAILKAHGLEVAPGN